MSVGADMSLSAREVAERGELESKSAEEILRWALEEFKDKVALASSFGAEDVVLIDMMVKIDPKARIFTLDTGRLNQETYDVMDKIREKYQISLEVVFPKNEAVEHMVRERGMNLFYQSVENRKLCCGVRKVEPLNRVLGTLSAWITGLRRDQVVTRTAIKKVDVDADHGGIIKINPLAEWSWQQVMDYVKQNQVPYNVLHDQGWERPDQKECGLHVGKH
jgi:phosphoadenosine phosphosulfate reductase